MIVKNEESCLGTCLKTIEGLDEIVILDTGSTDKTEDVAKGKNVKYIKDKYKWKDDFADARNEALKYTTCDYVLIIDADEQLVGGVGNLRTMVEAHNGVPTMQMLVKSDKGNNRHNVVRVHKVGEVKWIGVAHNYLSIQGGPVLQGVEIEYGYSPAHKQDPNRTFRILKKYCKSHPEAKRERYYLAREYWYRNRYDECLDQLNIYRKYGVFAMEIADSYLMSAKCKIMQNLNSHAWEYLFKALQINADLREAYVWLSKISGEKNRAHWLRMADTATNNDVLFIRG
jgi:glycosyltransferase involved in cell wall biosynthesis